MRGNPAQEAGSLNFTPVWVEWNEIPLHFIPVGQFGMGVKWHVTLGYEPTLLEI